MYKNIFYEYKRNLIHLWDDNDGYSKFPFQKTGYIKSSDSSGLTSIFGDPVKEVYLNQFKPNPNKFLESDVKPEHRVLIDRYQGDNKVSENVRITALDIEVEIDPKNPKASFNVNESPNPVLAITLLNFWDGSKITFLYDKNKGDRKYKNTYNYDFVKVFDSEKKMLKEFIRYWFNLKPEIITGWNIDFYDNPYLYNRLARLFDETDPEFKNFLSPVGVCRYSPKNKRLKIAGVSSLDYIKIYKKLTRKTRPSYALDYIVKVELDKNKIAYEGTLQDLYNYDIDKYVKYNIVDVELIFELDKKLGYISKSRGLAHESHVPYEDVLSAVQTTEGLFLHEAKEMGLVCPSKPITVKDWQSEYNNSIDGFEIDDGEIEDEEDKVQKENDKIVGAFVKTATSGRYDYTYDEDLTSLYPMIAVTLNISPETKWGMIENFVDVWMENDKTHYKINYDIFDPTQKIPPLDKEINIRVKSFKEKKIYKIKTIGQLYSFCNDFNLTISANGVFYSKDKVGVIPRIIMNIFNKRVEYKKLRNEALEAGEMDKYDYYENSQWRMKIVINSIYGVLSNKYFRFFDKDNAQSITLTGQFVNKSGMDTVKRIHKTLLSKMDKSGLDERVLKLFSDPIVAGDTDSVIMTAEPVLHYKFGQNWHDEGEEKLLKTTLDISEKMSKYINERMVTLADYWLNSDNNKLEFKEEWVATTGFYSGVKKRYANRLKLKEGVILDEPETDVKGLDIVRSDFPKRFQDFMSEFLDLLLDKKDNQINQFVLDFYNQIEEDAENDYSEIMKISSVNTMDKWKLEDNMWLKGTPIAVKAALNYNKFLHLNNLNGKFREIVQGDKIQWVYLNKNHYGFDTIAIPQYEYLSPLVEEFIKDNCAIQKTVSKLLDSKIESYYDAMNWTVPSENLTVDELFNL